MRSSSFSWYVFDDCMGLDWTLSQQKHGATSSTGFGEANVIFVLLPGAKMHQVMPLSNIDVKRDDDDKTPRFTVDEVIQRFAERTRITPDNRRGHRRPVVHAQWVHECVKGGKLPPYSDGWEIRSVLHDLPAAPHSD